MGRRILITSWGSYGDVYPCLGLALGLRARGHRPVLGVPDFYRGLVEEEGIEFASVGPQVDPSDRATVGRIMDTARGTEYIVRDLILPELRETYRDLERAAAGADLIVTHPITIAATLLARRESIPWVSTVLAPLSFFSAHDLPVFPPAPWVRRLAAVPGVARLVVGAARAVTRRWTRPVERLRADLGLADPGHPLFEAQHSPRAVLALFSRVLAAPQPDWPAAVTVTGAIPYNGPSPAVRLSDELTDFLDRGPPPIVFTLGSSAVGAAGDFYEVSAAASRRIRRRAVLLVGPHADNRPARPHPDVHVESFAPHSLLFPRACAIVHQGGAGTLHHGLRSGRPTVIVPFSHDQPDNAFRVERLGVSRTVPLRRYTARGAAVALRAVLDDPEPSRRAAEIATIVRSEDGVGSACDVIEGVLADD